MTAHASSIPGSRQGLPPAPASANGRIGPLLRRFRPIERAIETLLVGCALVSAVTTVLIIAVLSIETFHFFATDEVSIAQFLTGLEWNPLLGAEKHFGIWPLVCGTLLVTVVAMAIAIPFGLITALYISEYAAPGVRAVLKPVLEILAGVPTVVYGFFALTVITPVLQKLYSGFEVYNVTSAGLAVGIMCLPIVCSISEDSFRAVPNRLREGAYGIGATQFDVSLKIVFPAALSGIVAASLLAVARAVGETMIVALAAGNLARLTLNPTGQAQTMTAYVVQIFLGDASNFGPEYYSSYAVAASLFVMTLILTVIGHRVRVRFREEYE